MNSQLPLATDKMAKQLDDLFHQLTLSLQETYCMMNYEKYLF